MNKKDDKTIIWMSLAIFRLTIKIHLEYVARPLSHTYVNVKETWWAGERLFEQYQRDNVRPAFFQSIWANLENNENKKLLEKIRHAHERFSVLTNQKNTCIKDISIYSMRLRFMRARMEYRCEWVQNNKRLKYYIGT